MCCSDDVKIFKGKAVIVFSWEEKKNIRSELAKQNSQYREQILWDERIQCRNSYPILAGVCILALDLPPKETIAS